MVTEQVSDRAASAWIADPGRATNAFLSPRYARTRDADAASSSDGPGDQVRARSPSRLAATVTFDRVRPDSDDVVDGAADARHVGAALLAPGGHARDARRAGGGDLRREVAMGGRDAVDGAVERQPVEIIADGDVRARC